MASQFDAICPVCGFSYRRDLRTGLTYAEVFELLWSYHEDPDTWRYKRRHTVLGKWHQIKMELWEQHVAACNAQAAEDRVPF